MIIVAKKAVATPDIVAFAHNVSVLTQSSIWENTCISTYFVSIHATQILAPAPFLKGKL